MDKGLFSDLTPLRFAYRGEEAIPAGVEARMQKLRPTLEASG